MNKTAARQKSQEVREISVEIHLDGGHRHEVILREDAPELARFIPGPRQPWIGKRGPGRAVFPVAGGQGQCRLFVQFHSVGVGHYPAAG